MSFVEIDKPAAVEALRSAAHHYDDPDRPDHGRTLIHCFMGTVGADWDLDRALSQVSEAVHVGWEVGDLGSLLGHELAVIAPAGNVYRFDVKRPEPAG